MSEKCKERRDLVRQVLGKHHDGIELESMVNQYMKLSGSDITYFMNTNSVKLYRSGSKEQLIYDVVGQRAKMGLVTPISWKEHENGVELTYKTNKLEKEKTIKINKNGRSGNMLFQDVKAYFNMKNANEYSELVNAIRNSDKGGIEDKFTKQGDGSDWMHEKIVSGNFNELVDKVIELDNETDKEYLEHIEKISDIIGTTVDANKVVLEMWDKNYSRGQYNKINDKVRVKVTKGKILDSETTNTEALIHENGHAVIEIVEYSTFPEKQALLNEKLEIYKYLQKHLKVEDFILGEKTELSLAVAKRKYSHMMSDANELLPHMISNKAMLKWMKNHDKVEFKFQGEGLTTKILNLFEWMYHKMYDMVTKNKGAKMDKQIIDLLARYAVLNKKIGNKIEHKPNILSQVNKKIRKKVFEKIGAKYDKMKIKMRYNPKYRKLAWLIDSDMAKFTFEAMASMFSRVPIVGDIANDWAMLFSDVFNKRSSWFGKFEMLNLKSRQIDEEVQSIQKITEDEINKIVQDIDDKNIEQIYELVMFNDILSVILVI